MIVTAWNNGDHNKSGAGYGVKLEPGDRDRYFRRDWTTIHLFFEGSSNQIEINVAKPSFWGKTCRELINAELGRWLLRNGLAPWPKHNPPKLRLEHLEGNHFLLSRK